MVIVRIMMIVILAIMVNRPCFITWKLFDDSENDSYLRVENLLMMPVNCDVS